MKQIRLIGFILSSIALLLCFWSIISLAQEGADIVGETLNFLYFGTLLIALVCFRISLGYSNKTNLVIAALTLGVISSSTYTWMNPSELLITGKITLGLIPLLLGTTLMFIVKANSKTSKFLQLLIGFTAVTLSTCVFIGASAAFVYSVVLICLVIVTLSVLAYLIFARTN